MPTGSEGAKGRMKEAVGALTGDEELQLEGELQRKRDDAKLKTRGWTQTEAHTTQWDEVEDTERRAEDFEQGSA